MFCLKSKIMCSYWTLNVSHLIICNEFLKFIRGFRTLYFYSLVVLSQMQYIKSRSVYPSCAKYDLSAPNQLCVTICVTFQLISWYKKSVHRFSKIEKKKYSDYNKRTKHSNMRTICLFIIYPFFKVQISLYFQFDFTHAKRNDQQHAQN